MQFDVKSVFPHLAACAIFLLAAILYFSPQFSGKAIPQSDIISYRGMSQELNKFKAETGEESLWTNSMFGGMPSYQIKTVNSGNFLNKLLAPSYLFLKAPAGMFIAAMLSFYLLMVLMGVNSWLSIIGALAFGFATNNLILYEAGHITKLKALSYLPLLASGFILAFRKRYILGGLLFGIGAGLDLAANHVQMTYYFFLTLIIWGIIELVKNIKENTLPHFSKAVGVLFIGGLLAIGSSASNLWITYEYSKDTMRGEPILEKVATQSAATSSSQVNGLEWGYAMQWSNNTIDVFSSFIPGVAGGGSSQLVSSDSPYGKALNKAGARISGDFAAPLYWGGLPFTSGPAYFGAVMVLFFFIGLVLVKGPVKWWLGLGTLLTILLSMGSNLEWFNRLFFDYMPLYNKFRTPNSVLGVTTFLVPALAILALHNIITAKSSKQEILNSLKIGGGIAVAIALFFAFAGSSFFDFNGANDMETINRSFGGQLGPEILNPLVNALVETRAQLMASDSLRTLILMLFAIAATYGFVEKKIKLNILLFVIGALTVFDTLGVGMRYLNKDDFQKQSAINNTFKPRDVDTQILKDSDPHYRVYDATRPTFTSAQSSYFHKTIGGYHAAKLQRFQDIIDHHISKGNQEVLNMFNTKYFIMRSEQGESVQANPAAYGNAWFVDSIAMVSSNNEEIDALNTVNPRNAAIVHKEYVDYINGLNPSGSGTISLTSYKPNELKYSSQTSADELAVFSEVWYGPNKGWQAYIDGKEVDHIRVDYILRALKIPSGQHEIVFKFEPHSFVVGKTVASVSSLLLLIGLLAFLGFQFKNRATAIPIASKEETSKKNKIVKRKKRQ